MDIRRFFCCLLCAALLCPPCCARATGDGVTVAARSALLMHSSGEILFAKNERERLAPASVTKIMTLLLTMEAIEDGSLSYDDTVIGSAHAASMGGSQIWLKEGETFTVYEMIKCIAVASANDCSVAMAEHIAGSEEAFVAMMNQRAAQLGMEDTHFVNCCGLEAEGHLTSARDVGIMSAQLMKHERITEFTTIWMDTIRDGAFGLTNTNKMLKTYQGMIGLKTGYTSQAGYCLSGVAQRDGMTLIAVVLGAESSKSRNADVSALLNYGFANYTQTTLTTDVPLMPVEVALGKMDSVALRLDGSSEILIEKRALPTLEKVVEVAERVEAPVCQGEELGSFSVYSEGELLTRVPIVAAHDVERLTAMDLWRMLLMSAFMRTV